MGIYQLAVSPPYSNNLEVSRFELAALNVLIALFPTKIFSENEEAESLNMKYKQQTAEHAVIFMFASSMEKEGITDSQSILSWKGTPRIIECNS